MMISLCDHNEFLEASTETIKEEPTSTPRSNYQLPIVQAGYKHPLTALHRINS